MQMNDEQIQRLGDALEALNARIARLAMALDVALDDRAVVESLMVPPPAPSSERRAASAEVSHSAERRHTFQRQELRGLLLLRYHMETTSLNENGWQITRQALVQAEDHLLSHGFKPGADGLDLNDFFDLARG